MTIRRLTLGLIGSCLFGAGGRAMVYDPTLVQNQLDHALLVAEIETLTLEGKYDADLGVRFESRNRVTRIEKTNPDGGWLPQVGEEILLEGAGGEFRDLGVTITGYPRPYVGRKYLAHLRRKVGRSFEITGLEAGLKPIDGLRNYSRNRTDGSNGEGSGPFLYWDDSAFPIPFAISLPTFRDRPTFTPAVEASFETWRAVTGSRLDFMGIGCSNSSRNENDGINTVVYVADRWTFDSAAIAITRNFYIAGTSSRAGLILDSDILLNGVNHSFTVTGESGKHDIQNIVTHEVGHFIGLGHEISPFDSDATMYAVASPGETKKRSLNTTDLSGIRAAYPGVGNKLSTNIRSCALPERVSGCGAVHQGNVSARSIVAGAFLIILYVGLLILGGRLMRMRRIEEEVTSDSSSLS